MADFVQDRDEDFILELLGVIVANECADAFAVDRDGFGHFCWVINGSFRDRRAGVEATNRIGFTWSKSKEFKRVVVGPIFDGQRCLLQKQRDCVWHALERLLDDRVKFCTFGVIHFVGPR